METNFGFKKVEEKEKTFLVGEVFSSVAPKYDIMNDFMSFGLHRLWKKYFVNKISFYDKQKFLDLAGGTGDISFAILEKAKKYDKKIEVTLSDINQEMLKEGKSKAIDKNILSDNLFFKQANVEKLPFADNSFDICTIAFGIRNVTNIPKALKEIYRVLKPTGKFLCLEFSQVENDILKKIYQEYSFKIIPKIGAKVVGDKDSYQYLVESIKLFPDGKKFEEMLEKTGFLRTNYEKLNFGIVAIHEGTKI